MHLNFKVFGEGFPVVILHGLFGMLDNWQSFGKKLAERGYMVYLIDQRDHGKSPFTSAFNYQLLSDDLALFMEQNWLYKAHVIGHSMGGKTAMQFAFDHSDFVQKMVIVDICNKKYAGGHEIIFNAIKSLKSETIGGREEAYEHFKFHGLDESSIQFLLKNLQRKKEGGYEWKMNYMLLERAYDAILSSVGTNNQHFDKETLFVKGENSDYITDSDKNNIMVQFPNASIVTIPNAGHWVHADQSEVLLEKVINFFHSPE